VAEVIILPLAEADLEDLWISIAVDSPQAADRMVERILKRIAVLERYPEMCQLRPELGTGIRLLVEQPYVVPYRIKTTDIVEVIRVLHGARNALVALDGL
jgi:toxin ParE1/3/4